MEFQIILSDQVIKFVINNSKYYASREEGSIKECKFDFEHDKENTEILKDIIIIFSKKSRLTMQEFDTCFEFHIDTSYFLILDLSYGLSKLEIYYHEKIFISGFTISENENLICLPTRIELGYNYPIEILVNLNKMFYSGIVDIKLIDYTSVVITGKKVEDELSILTSLGLRASSPLRNEETNSHIQETNHKAQETFEDDSLNNIKEETVNSTKNPDEIVINENINNKSRKLEICSHEKLSLINKEHEEKSENMLNSALVLIDTRAGNLTLKVEKPVITFDRRGIIKSVTEGKFELKGISMETLKKEIELKCEIEKNKKLNSLEESKQGQKALLNIEEAKASKEIDSFSQEKKHESQQLAIKKFIELENERMKIEKEFALFKAEIVFKRDEKRLISEREINSLKISGNNDDKRLEIQMKELKEKNNHLISTINKEIEELNKKAKEYEERSKRLMMESSKQNELKIQELMKSIEEKEKEKIRYENEQRRLKEELERKQREEEERRRQERLRIEREYQERMRILEQQRIDNQRRLEEEAARARIQYSSSRQSSSRGCGCSVF